jgi:hypothetical protein
MSERMISNTDLDALARQVLQAGCTLRFVVSGTSMHPFLQDGDVVELAPLGDHPLGWSEVALARAPGGMLVLHRVYRLRRSKGVCQLLLRGDNRPDSDGWISPSDVLGRVQRAWRSSQRLSLISPLVWAWMVLAILRGRLRSR